MSGDWIAMRTSLAGNRHVLSIARYLASEQLYGDDLQFNITVTLGGLHRFWSWAQEETVDGFIEGVDVDAVSSVVGVRSFGDALKKAKWLIVKSDGVEIPQFDKYMGNGAKRRLKDARRKGLVRKVSARMRTKCGTTEQKSKRGQNRKSARSSPSSSKTRKTPKNSAPAQMRDAFAAWWEYYPRKVGKGAARKAYERATEKATHQVLVDAVSDYMVATDKWTKADKRYIPYPATWLNQERWSDDPKTWKREDRDDQRNIVG